MRLTRYTDYAIRVMIHLGVSDRELVSIAEIARAYDVSHANLMKVVQDLGEAGYVETVRGRHGGVRLARPAGSVNVGALVRHTEASFELAECGDCLITSACGLRGVLAEAMGAFLAVLDKYTLADLIGRRSALQALLATPPPLLGEGCPEG